MAPRPDPTGGTWETYETPNGTYKFHAGTDYGSPLGDRFVDVTPHRHRCRQCRNTALAFLVLTGLGAAGLVVGATVVSTRADLTVDQAFLFVVSLAIVLAFTLVALVAGVRLYKASGGHR